jgi:hypothetical protein
LCLCVTTNLKASKAFSQIKPSVSVKQILKSSWESFESTHEIREVEQKEVEKALDCYGHKNGSYVYSCTKCGAWIFQSLGCNSRICSNCGKRHADAWAVSLSQSMFKIPHRHFVISVPSILWPYLKQDRSLWKTYMDSAIDTCNDYFPKLMRKHKAKVGIIVIFHPFGKDMKFQPHLHLIITEGAFDRAGRFIKQEFVPARKFAKCWQYHVSTNLQRAGVPSEVFTYTYRKYDGFYVWVHKAGRIRHPKLIARYLGRYVRHPAIANSRLISFDRNKVGFFYEVSIEESKEKIRHDVTMRVDDFISALIQHIPEQQFKMIRYYGAYARRSKKAFKSYLQSSIEQTKLTKFGVKIPGRVFHCPYCGGDLEFVMYMDKGPPEISKPQKELVEWINGNSKN